MTSQTRKIARQAGKSDPIDARVVALAVVRDGIESFPVAFTDAQAMQIRVLADYRDQIISERTRMINRLRWHLVAIAPELEAQLNPVSLRGPRICARLTRQLARLTPSFGSLGGCLSASARSCAKSASCSASSPD
jgi:transposase